MKIIVLLYFTFRDIKKTSDRIDSAELDIFISHDYVVTLHEGEFKPLVELAQNCQINERLAT